MAEAVDTVVIGFDDFARRSGVSITDPSGWTKPSRMRDELTFLGARSGGASGADYYAFDLGVGVTDRPTFAALMGTNLAQKGVDVGIDYDDTAWTSPTRLVTTTPVGRSHMALIADFSATSGDHRYWRWVFLNVPDADVIISEAYLGRHAFSLIQPTTQGFDPTAGKPNVRRSRSEAGYLVRATYAGTKREAKIRTPGEFDAVVRGDYSQYGFKTWVDQYLLGGRPFVWSWHAKTPGNYPRDCFYARATAVSRVLRNAYRKGWWDVEFTLVGGRTWEGVR